MGNLERKGKDRKNHWNELLAVIEEEWKEKIENLGYKRGCLQIGVTSTVLLQEITQFHRKPWLEALKKEGSKVKDIKVKLIEELGDHSD